MKLAVIPARGGSKRIPRKNVRLFAGRPIIGYSIAAAQKSGLFDEIVVSTDDEEIADVARGLGANVPFSRPVALADDFTGTNAVVGHAVRWFSERGKDVVLACCIYATAPFVQARYLRKGHDALVEGTSSFAFSVTTFPAPVQRAIRLDERGAVHALHPEYAMTRSQDLVEAFHDAAQFYWGRADAFVEGTMLFSPASLGIVIPRHLVQDIDTLEDWRRAEIMYDVLQRAGEADA